MNPPIVINCRKAKPQYYVGRYSSYFNAGGVNLSILGNGSPFPNDRTKAIKWYRQWLWSNIKHRNGPIVEAIMSIQPGATIGCWCHPLPCHADVIVNAWKWLHNLPIDNTK